MTIKEIKENYKDYRCKKNERNSFVTTDYNDSNGKVVIIVNICGGFGKTVTQMAGIKKRIDVVLTEEQLDMLKQMQKEGVYGDNLTLNELMANIFFLQLREDIDYFSEAGF